MIIPINATEETPKRKENEPLLDYVDRISEWRKQQKKQSESTHEQPANDGGNNNTGFQTVQNKSSNEEAKPEYTLGEPILDYIDRLYEWRKQQEAQKAQQVTDEAKPEYTLGEPILDYIDRLYEWRKKQQEAQKALSATGSGKNMVGIFHEALNELENKVNRLFKALLQKLTDKIADLKKRNSDNKKKLVDKEFSGLNKTGNSETQQPKKNIAAQGKSFTDKIRKAKVHRPDSFTAATPASLAWDGGVEVVARAVETGAVLADAIRQGVTYVKNTDWYKNLSESKKEAAEDDFVNWHNDQSGLTDLQSQFVDKRGNDFTADDSRAIWTYMKQTYLDNGTEYNDALSYTAKDLGLTMRQVNNATVTPKNKPLSDAVWKNYRDLRLNRNATKRWIDEQSQSEAYKAFRKTTYLFSESAMFGNGAIFAGTHAMPTLFDLPRSKYAVKAMFNAYKMAYGNTADYELMMRDLENSPNYLKAQRAGLQNDPRTLGSDSEIASDFFKKLTSVGERGFNAIKILRQELFDSHYERLTAEEREDPEAIKAIAQIINNATGATNMKMPGWMRDETFTDGMEVFRWERIVKNSLKAIGIFTKWNSSTVGEKVFARLWAQRAGMISGVYLSALAINEALNYYIHGDDKHRVNFTDPIKDDWLHFKIGDTDVNPTSGMLSALRFAIGLGSIAFEDEKMMGKKFRSGNRLDAAAQKTFKYAEGKLSPGYSAISEIALRHDYNENTLPMFDEKPYNKYAHQLTYVEYALSKAPFPIAEASRVYFEAIRDQGATDDAINAWMKAIEHRVISG